MENTKISAIVLAGGESKRAHANKMLFEFGHKPLILHTIDSVRPFVDKIIVVTGKYHKELAPILTDVEICYNKNYKKGMFSSVKAGVACSEGNFFIIPGDCPFVSEDVFKKLSRDGEFNIRVPFYFGDSGHPIYLDSKMKDVIAKEPVESNLKALRDRIGYQKVEVKDVNILNDIDTIKDYQQMLKALERN